MDFRARRAELFPDATDAQWNDWKWQLRHSARDGASLARVLSLTDDERAGLDETAKIFRVGVSPYYLSLIDPAHEADIRREIRRDLMRAERPVEAPAVGRVLAAIAPSSASRWWRRCVRWSS